MKAYPESITESNINTMPPRRNNNLSIVPLREMIAFFGLIGSWVWFFSSQSNDVKANTKSISVLADTVSRVTESVNESKVRHAQMDEHIKGIESSLSEIKNAMKK